MARVRIAGLVREAERVRRAMAAPLATEQRGDLAAEVQRTLLQVDAILAQCRATPRGLPAPSQRAYSFLKRVGLELARPEAAGESLPTPASPSIRPQETATEFPARTAESVTFRGLRGFLESTLDEMARAVDANRFRHDAWLGVIGETARRLEHSLERDALRPEHLKAESRELIGWFRYFSRLEALERYADAVGRAQRILGGAKPRGAEWRRPIVVHFRPSSHLYRWKVRDNGTLIVLPTPMITASDEVFGYLAAQIGGSRRHAPAVNAAMLSSEYQALSRELERLGGQVEHARGMIHDLADCFVRVNREYFAGALPRPKLSWSRTLTGRKFGHYDFVEDTVMISSSLDSPRVPAFVVDHVMHHELLHKKHGVRWSRGRRQTHTPIFRADERRFPHFRSADEFLKRLARGVL